jgi:hypothetical protein
VPLQLGVVPAPIRYPVYSGRVSITELLATVFLNYYVLRYPRHQRFYRGLAPETCGSAGLPGYVPENRVTFLMPRLALEEVEKQYHEKLVKQRADYNQQAKNLNRFFATEKVRALPEVDPAVETRKYTCETSCIDSLAIISTGNWYGTTMNACRERRASKPLKTFFRN